MSRYISSVIAALILSTLIACGGGGGSSDSGNGGSGVNPPTNVAPTANAGSDQTVDEQTEVTLTGSGTDSDGSIVSYSWVQTAGTSVTLSDPTSATTTFTAPDVSADETLTFELTVTDDDGAISTDTVNITVVNEPVIATVKLNDTGITSCSNNSGNGLSCPVTGFEGQDAEHGRDAQAAAGTLSKVGAGRAGFDFTKLDANGNSLPASAIAWSCVKDNHTGLIWEVKTTDGGLHDINHTYSWYNPDASTNGGSAGTQNGSTCSGSECDTHAFVNAVNTAGLCGASDWRLPSREELRSLVDYSIAYPGLLIDTDYFPNTRASRFWSSSPDASDSGDAWVVYFHDGYDGTLYKGYDGFVRLVRAGQ